MESIVQDFRYAVRALRRSAGFTTVAVLTLGLGMGATAAIYALLRHVVLDPLPYPEAARLIRLKNAVPGIGAGEEWNLSSAQYFHYRERARSIDGLGAYSRFGVNIQGTVGPVRAGMAVVTAGTLPLLTNRPYLGRFLSEAEDVPGAPSVVMLSYDFWRRNGSDSGLVGRALQLNGYAYEVVGVLAPGVELPADPGAPPAPSDVWVPMRLDPAGPFFSSHPYQVIARLRAGTTLAMAQTEFDQLTRALGEAYPGVYSTRFMERYGFAGRLYNLKEHTLGGVARNLWVVFAALGLVFLIALGNVTNLVLARIEVRRRETVLRSALGADRFALARHHFAEAATLVLGGCVLALVVTGWGIGALSVLPPAQVSAVSGLSLSRADVAFGIGLALVATAVLSIPGLLDSFKGQRTAVLGRSGRVTFGETERLRGGLIVTQVALAVILAVAASLLGRSFSRLTAVSPGIVSTGVLTVQLYLPPTERYNTPVKMWEFYRTALERLSNTPGVSNAGLSTALPLTGTYACTGQVFEDGAIEERARVIQGSQCSAFAPTSPGYFESLGIPLIAGRTFQLSDNDHPETGAVVVSRAFADRFWPGENPLGKGVKPYRQGAPYYRVVGVVGDVHDRSLSDPPAPVIYYPMVAIPGQPSWWPPNVFLSVRSSGTDAMALLPQVRRVLRDVDPGIPLANTADMQSLVDRSMTRQSFTALLLTGAAAAAILLAGVGLYGVISYIVARRTGEIGLRIALGALPNEVERLVMRRTVRLTLVGIGAGVLVALAVTRVWHGMLYGVSALDPVSYAGAVAFFLVISLVAAWLPARRAARVDPVVALRSE